MIKAVIRMVCHLFDNLANSAVMLFTYLLCYLYHLAALAQYLPDDDKQDGQNEIRLAQMQVGGDTLKRTLTLGESEEFGRESSISNTPDTNKKDDALRLRKTNSSRRREHRERQQSLFDIAKDSPLVKLAEASMQEKNQDERRQEQPLQQQATAPLPKMPQFLHARYKVWSILQFLKKYEFKFALKVAVAVSILCIPAFVPTSRGWFIHERVQWASVTVSIVKGTLHAYDCGYDDFTRFVGDSYYESYKVGTITGFNAFVFVTLFSLYTVVAHCKLVSGESSALLSAR